MRNLLILLVSSFFMLSANAYAVDPGERLNDQALEDRARTISQELRCLVCQNQSIDGSDAPLARDLRILVRERLVAGDSDAEILDFVVARYGEFVLLRPRLHRQTWLLWFAPFAILLVGILSVVLVMRGRKETSAGPAPLSAEEKARLEEIVNDRERQ